MFETVCGSNKGHVYGFDSQSATITVERQGGSSSSSLVHSVSSGTAHESYIEREMRLWGYMQQAQDKFAGFITPFASQCGGQIDSVPTLFLPLPKDNATSQPPTGPPSSSSLSPPT
ncbi:hypothetical protein M9H77_22265 [Catharanthus roseus]|uniref:Uncharacterized protein n=1 Tax=Catharanthus roseus TaxID=4058 RepID=A0ACC0ASJ6_CATRO|nr:hypothetical protein M9H77_22265 [Catharanthus roseus]